MPSVSRAFGGPTESLVGYARAAHIQGIRVHVAAPAVSTADQQWIEKQLPDARFHFFPSVGRHAWVLSPSLWGWLWTQGAKYDVLHIHGLFNPVSSLSACIAVAKGYPTVIRPFGTLSRYTFSRRRVLKQMYFRLLDRPALRRAAGVHFTTTAERDEASRLSLNLDSRAHVVPPPLREEDRIFTEEARCDRPTVLFLSRLHPKKNVSGLLDAWREVVDERPEAQLWIAGDGDDEYVRELKVQAQRLGLNEQVSFLGFVQGEEKRRVLQEAWAFALPSYQENLGVAVLEAIAAGLPVVISPDVQVKSFVEENDLGHVVPREKTALANALNSVLEDAFLRSHVAERGPDAVRETFSIETVGTQLAKMYADVV